MSTCSHRVHFTTRRHHSPRTRTWPIIKICRHRPAPARARGPDEWRTSASAGGIGPRPRTGVPAQTTGSSDNHPKSPTGRWRVLARKGVIRKGVIRKGVIRKGVIRKGVMCLFLGVYKRCGCLYPDTRRRCGITRSPVDPDRTRELVLYVARCHDVQTTFAILARTPPATVGLVPPPPCIASASPCEWRSTPRCDAA